MSHKQKRKHKSRNSEECASTPGQSRTDRRLEAELEEAFEDLEADCELFDTPGTTKLVGDLINALKIRSRSRRKQRQSAAACRKPSARSRRLLSPRQAVKTRTQTSTRLVTLNFRNELFVTSITQPNHQSLLILVLNLRSPPHGRVLGARNQAKFQAKSQANSRTNRSQAKKQVNELSEL